MANNTKGTAFVVYEDVMDAKQACDKLNGFNFQNRYLVGTWECSSERHNLVCQKMLMEGMHCSAISPAGEDGEDERRSC